MSKQSVIDNLVIEIYENLNLLTIKKSVRQLLKLELKVIEEFVRRYSSTVIFLLNILDIHRANQLLERFSDSSLIYIMEEEIRLLLIREIASCGEDPEILMELTMFLDAADNSSRELTFSNQLTEHIYTAKMGQNHKRFSYIDTLSHERRVRCFHLLMEQNLASAIGVLIYSSRSSAAQLLDQLAENSPQYLKLLPEELFHIRFETPYDIYLNEGIFSCLPPGISEQIRYLNQSHGRFQEKLANIRSIQSSGLSAHQIRQKVMDTIYEMLKEVRPAVRELLLHEMIQWGMVEKRDLPILLAMVQDWDSYRNRGQSL